MGSMTCALNISSPYNECAGYGKRQTSTSVNTGHSFFFFFLMTVVEIPGISKRDAVPKVSLVFVS